MCYLFIYLFIWKIYVRILPSETVQYSHISLTIKLLLNPPLKTLSKTELKVKRYFLFWWLFTPQQPSGFPRKSRKGEWIAGRPIFNTT